MFLYDPYNGDMPDHYQNCYQQALKIAAKHGVDKIYWLPTEQHYYVVIPGSEFALGDTEHYPKKTATAVIKEGIPVSITEEDKAIWM